VPYAKAVTQGRAWREYQREVTGWSEATERKQRKLVKIRDLRIESTSKILCEGVKSEKCK
jgi:hypothetical protein